MPERLTPETISWLWPLFSNRRLAPGNEATPVKILIKLPKMILEIPTPQKKSGIKVNLQNVSVKRFI